MIKGKDSRRHPGGSRGPWNLVRSPLDSGFRRNDGRQKTFLLFIILYLLAFTFYLLPSAQAEGLSTPFADVQVGSVPVGKPFLITGSMGNGLLLRNLGDAAVRVRVDVLQPPTAELRSGAAPIPDVHWIQVEPDRLELPAHGEAVCRIMLLVPAQRKYRRKQYQATLWSRTEPSDAKPVALSAGLLSRVRFKTQ